METSKIESLAELENGRYWWIDTHDRCDDSHVWGTVENEEYQATTTVGWEITRESTQQITESKPYWIMKEIYSPSAVTCRWCDDDCEGLLT